VRLLYTISDVGIGLNGNMNAVTIKLENARCDIIGCYQSEMSLREIAEIYDCSFTAIENLLKRHGVQLRTRVEANRIKANQKEFQDRRRDKLMGKPSGATGKKWKLNHRKYCPSNMGANNPQWKGGRTALSKLIRTLPEYAKWRCEIFERDNFQCVHCGRRNCVGDKVIIHADHIDPLWKLIEQNSIKSTLDAIQCCALWNTNNGRTLCKECHKLTKTYGCNKKK